MRRKTGQHHGYSSTGFQNNGSAVVGFGEGIFRDFGIGTDRVFSITVLIHSVTAFVFGSGVNSGIAVIAVAGIGGIAVVIFVIIRVGNRKVFAVTILIYAVTGDFGSIGMD